MSTIVDTTTLAKLIGVSLLAGIGVTGMFALAILGITRFDEARRSRQGIAAGVFVAIAALALAACVAAVALGIIAMTQKS